jgi:hypothetical protein
MGNKTNVQHAGLARRGAYLTSAITKEEEEEEKLAGNLE